jgi:DnaK suppressor protein
METSMPAKKPAAKTAKAKKPAPKKAAPKPVAAKRKVVAKAAPKPKAAPAAKPAVKAAPPKAAPAKPIVLKTLATKVPAPAPKPVPAPVPAPKAAAPAPKKDSVKPTPKTPATSGRAQNEPRAEVAPPVATTRTAAAPESGARPIATTRMSAAQPDGEEEGYESGASSLSLLAGPRNVKPYLAKKGEQYMGAEQLNHFRKILETWKRDLMEEVDRTVTHMKDEAANPPDPNDRATLESEFSLELRTRDRERKLIRKIDEALKRIEDGSYGYCLETGEEIGIKRLEARPVATLSIEAQERRERREKQYGDRDDRYR